MVTDSPAYIELVTYLTENIGLFEKSNHLTQSDNSPSVRDVIEDTISSNMINFFDQHPDLDVDTRLTIIRETDSIVTDLEELLASRLEQSVNSRQREFLTEFASLIKNLFDGYARAS